MCSRTYESYDVNEYFLKFLTIHPILVYSPHKINQKKKEFQLYLLDEFNKENITYDELSNQYNKIIEYERQGLIELDTLKFYHKTIEESMKKSYETNMKNIYSLLLKNKKN